MRQIADFIAFLICTAIRKFVVSKCFFFFKELILFNKEPLNRSRDRYPRDKRFLFQSK